MKNAVQDLMLKKGVIVMKRMDKVIFLMLVGVILLLLMILLCGNNAKVEEVVEEPKVELMAEGYVLQMGDNIWSLYEEFGEGIEWDVFQREILSRNDNAGSFMREGERITIVYAKK